MVDDTMMAAGMGSGAGTAGGRTEGSSSDPHLGRPPSGELGPVGEPGRSGGQGGSQQQGGHEGWPQQTSQANGLGPWPLHRPSPWCLLAETRGQLVLPGSPCCDGKAVVPRGAGVHLREACPAACMFWKPGDLQPLGEAGVQKWAPEAPSMSSHPTGQEDPCPPSPRQQRESPHPRSPWDPYRMVPARRGLKAYSQSCMSLSLLACRRMPRCSVHTANVLGV